MNDVNFLDSLDFLDWYKIAKAQLPANCIKNGKCFNCSAFNKTLKQCDIEGSKGSRGSSNKIVKNIDEWLKMTGKLKRLKRLKRFK